MCCSSPHMCRCCMITAQKSAPPSLQVCEPQMGRPGLCRSWMISGAAWRTWTAPPKAQAASTMKPILAGVTWNKDKNKRTKKLPKTKRRNKRNKSKKLQQGKSFCLRPFGV